MKLKVREMEAQERNVSEIDFFDLLDIEDQLYQWLKPIFLIDEEGNLDPKIVEVCSIGINVDRVIIETIWSDDRIKIILLKF